MDLINIDEYFQNSLSSQSVDNMLKSIIKDISTESIKLEDIFKSLEPYLTSKDNQKRSKSIKLISELIRDFPENRLNSLEIDNLTTYLCSKLDDHYSVSTAALPGLYSLLTKYQPIDEKDKSNNVITLENSVKIIKTVLTAVHVQSMVQSDRYTVFDMCKFILSSQNLIKKIKNEKYETDFVYGFIQSMDGEKDPRNLLICFECIRLICSQINLGPFIEETFEVFACYFPIDFTPPKNDSFIITKQMLIESLRACFSSTNKFTKNTIPLLMEKLDSNSEDAQLDALETYSECANTTYDPNDYKEYLEPLWNSFHKISMNATKTNLEEAALKSIQSIAKSLSKSVQNANSKSNVSIEWFSQRALDSCLVYLNEPDLKLVWPNVKCLLSIASASSTANLLILKSTLPALIAHYNSNNFQNQKKTYLEILWQFISNSLKFDKVPSDILKENIDQMLQICLTNESNKHLRLQSLNGLFYLLSFERLVEEANKLDSADLNNYDTISKVLWHSLWIKSTENESSPTFNEESSRLNDIFYLLIQKDRNILQWYFKSLEESIFGSINSGNENYLVAFKLIENMTSLYSKYRTDKNQRFDASELILNLFKNLIQNMNHREEFMHKLYETLTVIIYNLNIDEHHEPDLMKILYEIIQNLLDYVISDKYTNISQILSIKCSLVFKAFCLLLGKTEQSESFLNKVNTIFLAQTENFAPFEIESKLADKQKLIFYMQIVASLNKAEFKNECEQIFQKIETKLRTLSIERSQSQDEKKQEQINQISCQFYSSLLNKIENNLTEKYVNQFKESLLIDIENSENATTKRLGCLNFWIWITKALALKEHKLYEFFANKLIDWSDYVILSKQTSEGFSTILNECSNECFVMTNKSATNIKLFYRQRFFNFVIEPLKKKFDSKTEINNSQRLYYAMSVLNMISILPKEIIHKQLKSMLPILLFSLSNSENMDNKLCLSSLRSFEILLNECAKNDDSSFISYLSEILDKLIFMAKSNNLMDIRLLSLNCLNTIALNLPPNQIIKYQKFVCKELEKCLTDKKRLCRQLAVEARNRWFLLTTKNSE